MVKLLVNAAGVYSPERGLKSNTGLDYGYAVNFVGPVLFMQMLHPLLRAHTPSLVINVTCQEYSKCKELDMHYIRRMQDVARKQGRLRVYVDKCRDLPSTSGQGMATSFVKLSVSGQEHSTKVHKGTVSPSFRFHTHVQRCARTYMHECYILVYV